jgi:hypothetical protein
MTELPNQVKNNKSFDEKGAQFVWDATSLTSAETCLRKYYYTHILGWQNDNKSFHLTFGSHYATALEHYYKHRALGDSSAQALEKVVFETLVNTWYRTEENPEGSPWLSPDSAKTRENLIRTIIWYVDQFENERISVVTLGDGRPAVEHSFSFEVDNGMFFAGHLDRLVEYVNDLYVMDQKTTGGAISNYYFNNFNPDIQMSMYTFAGKAIFNLPVKGVIIDAAQIMVGFTRFERGFTFRTQSQLDEWYDDTMYRIEVTRKATLENYFPMNKTACGNYGGCPFRSVCSRSPEVRANFLAADFRQGPTWDPLTRR